MSEISVPFPWETIKRTLSFAKGGCSVKQGLFFLILSLPSTSRKNMTLNYGALIRYKLYHYYP